jgi:hypothetical protein
MTVLPAFFVARWCMWSLFSLNLSYVFLHPQPGNNTLFTVFEKMSYLIRQALFKVKISFCPFLILEAHK